MDVSFMQGTSEVGATPERPSSPSTAAVARTVGARGPWHACCGSLARGAIDGTLAARCTAQLVFVLLALGISQLGAAPERPGSPQHRPGGSRRAPFGRFLTGIASQSVLQFFLVQVVGSKRAHCERPRPKRRRRHRTESGRRRWGAPRPCTRGGPRPRHACTFQSHYIVGKNTCMASDPAIHV